MVIYAIVNSEGYISGFVNGQMAPHIIEQFAAVPAPDPDIVLELGKVWRRMEQSWVQVPDPRGVNSHDLANSLQAKSYRQGG